MEKTKEVIRTIGNCICNIGVCIYCLALPYLPLLYNRRDEYCNLCRHITLAIWNVIANIFDPASRERRHDRRTRNQRWQKRQKNTAEKKRVLARRPHPLPPSRLNISQISLPTTAGVYQPPRSQPPLLSKLPLEIRHLIYTLVLDGNRFHLFHEIRNSDLNGPLRLLFLRCTFNRCFMNDFSSISQCPADSPLNQWRKTSSAELSDPIPLDLLFTCRQIYREAADILYSSNIFHVSDLNVLVYLANYRIRPQRLRAIKQLELRWIYYSDPAMTGSIHEPYDWETWEQVWEIIGTRMALTSLNVRLAYWGPEEDMNIDAQWIAPMLKVNGIRHVEVSAGRLGNSVNAPAESLSEQLRESMMRAR